METTHVAIWMAIGAAIGWVATRMKPDAGHTVFLENIATAIFGSFIGGEFVAVVMRASPKDTSLTILSVALAVACSVIALVLLQVMRRAVGPLRSGKPKRGR